MNTKTIILLAFILLLSSCVGTIQDSGKPVTYFNKESLSLFNFDGIKEAVATAQSKVRVSFLPATGGSGEFSYQVYKDGNFDAPAASIASTAIELDYRGYINVTIKDLKPGTIYKFSVRAFDIKNELQDINAAEKIVTTLNYYVPLFNGISSLENVAGASGKTQLIAKWIPALPSATSEDPFAKNPQDISGYNIYKGTKPDQLFFHGSTNDPQASQFLITGLESGVNYFVRVRAKNSQSTGPLEELNLEYKEKSTNTDAAIDFKGLTNLSLLSGRAGLNGIKLDWQMGSGNYDRYRIFISTTPKSKFNPIVDKGFTSDILSLSTLSANMLVPSAHTIYYVAVVACQDAACNTFAGEGNVQAIKTTPPVAPFNGIKSLSQPNDANGLNSVILTWDKPDTTKGIYNKISVFKTDSAGNYTQQDEIGLYNPASPQVIGMDSTQITETSVVIKGLAENVEYCFIAEAASTTPFDATNPLGRTTSSKKKLCFTPRYNYPGFAGVDPTCSNIQGSSFDITWSAPQPEGLFSYFEVYMKPGSSGFNIQNATSGDSSYTKFSVDKNLNRFTLSSLQPSSTYQIAVKTYFRSISSGNDLRDTNLVVATCSTTTAKVVHNGWLEIFAIGPKINGQTGAPIKERLRTRADGDYLGALAMEDAEAIEGASASTNGIVRLVWKDFDLTAGLGRMYDYASSTNGYKIYRKPYTSDHDTLPPKLTDLDWGQPLNKEMILPQLLLNPTTQKMDRYEVEFNDYTVQQPTSEANQIYWYKVEAYINGRLINFDSEASDAVVKVILPGKNQALAHRWMLNKQLCDMVNRPVSRSHHYRCEYTGFGSKNGYWDTGSHLIVDRFEMGCKFTRGNEEKKCSGSGANFLGSSTNADQKILQGDCLFDADPTTISTVTAPFGAVAYSRSNRGCYVNTSTGTSGSSWTLLNNLEQASSGVPVAAESSLFPLNTRTTSRGIARGADIVSNSAKLAPVMGVNQFNGNNLCKSFKVDIQKNTNTKLTFLKRLPAKAESTWLKYPSMDMTPSNLGLIYSSSYPTAAGSRGCNTSNNNNSTLRPLQTTLDLSKDNWVMKIINPTAVHYGYSISTPIRASGSYSVDSTVASTDFCQSKFGVQDLVGNVAEWLADQGAMNPTEGTSMKWQDPTSKTRPVVQMEEEILQYWTNGNNEIYERTTSGTGVFTGLVSIRNYYDDVNVNFISPTLGMPLTCSGSSCNGGSDDNVLIHKSQSLISNSALIFNFPWLSVSATTGLKSQGDFYSSTTSSTRFGLYLSEDTNNWSIGKVKLSPFSPPEINANPFATGQVQASGYTGFIGFRCLAKIPEDDNGSFEAP